MKRIKIAETLGAVHTHTHTQCRLEANLEYKKILLENTNAHEINMRFFEIAY